MNPPESDSGPAQAARHGAEDAAVWAVAGLGARPGEEWASHLIERAGQAEAAAAIARERLVEAATSGDLLRQIAERWGNTAPAQFGGRLFEFQQRTTFNMNAISHEPAFRAQVTEFEGIHPDPHAAADINLFDAFGNLIGGAQAKAVDSTYMRVHELASDRYQGLQLVVPADHVESAQDLLARRLDAANPEFLKHDAYLSVHDRLSGVISVQGVASDPISSQDLADWTRDPQGALQGMIDRERAAAYSHLDDVKETMGRLPLADAVQIGGAALAGGLAGAGVSIILGSVVNAAKVRTGELDPMAAAITAVSSASSALARGSFVGGLGQALNVLADHATLGDSFAGGDISFACGRAVWEIGAIGALLAKGEIQGPEAAERAAKSLMRIAFTFGGATVGQALVPIPIVGALIGGTVGSICAAVTLQGLAMARAGWRELQFEDEDLRRLETEVEAAIIVLTAEVDWLEQYCAERDIAYKDVVLPSLRMLSDSILAGDFAAALPAAATIIRGYGSEPVFTTMAEFERWMHEQDSALILDPNPRSNRA